MIKGWDKIALKDIATIVSGSTPSTANPSYWGGGIFWCTPTDITGNKGKYLSQTERTIKKAAVPHTSGILPVGTLLLCSRATIGEMCIAKVPTTTNQGFKNIIANKGISNEFIYYMLKTKKAEMLAKSHGSTFFEISKKAMDEFQIEIPKEYSEQKAIANTLSDMDSLIENLEKLIAKKKLIKHGTMQQLLTGKKRLPGFSDKWKEVELVEIIKRFATGLNPRENFQLNRGGDCYYVTIKNFRVNKLFLETCDKVTAADLCIINNRSDLRKNDILFSSIGRIGDTYLIESKPQNWNINESVFSLRPDTEQVSPRFMSYCLSSEQALREMTKSISGSTLTSIKMNQLKALKLKIPTDLTEQAAIATILFDMDGEITSHTQQLAKYKLVKQGMMEQLLTGKIRLVETAKEAAVEKPKHNQQFEDAIWIANIVAACANPGYPFGRVKLQKILYLTKRLRHEDTSTFGIHAAGPYDSDARYNGGEAIAKQKNYIIASKNPKGPGYSFTTGVKIDEAKKYFTDWGFQVYGEVIKNLLKFCSVDQLELYATVDKAVEELKAENKTADLKTVKLFIENHEEWKAKLDRSVFCDTNIEKAIAFSNAISAGGNE